MTREEAIKHLKEVTGWANFWNGCYKEKKEAINMAIEALQKRPKGRWEFVELKDHPLYGKPHKVGEWRCPFCGRAVAFKPPYCHCGADMRGEEE